jgi:hypothetical protein
VLPTSFNNALKFLKAAKLLFSLIPFPLLSPYYFFNTNILPK